MALAFICAFGTNNKENPNKYWDELVQTVEELRSQVDDLKNELDYVKTNVGDQESRIQANEEGLEVIFRYLIIEKKTEVIMFFLISLLFRLWKLLSHQVSLPVWKKPV